MKYTLYIALAATLVISACSSSPNATFSEEETVQQDSLDQANQEEAFDELLNDSDSTQNDTISE